MAEPEKPSSPPPARPSVAAPKVPSKQTEKSASPQGLVVSIHDVSPLTWKQVRHALADLRREGIERTSLLVIPNHHRKAPIQDDPEFCDWLQGEHAAGHEIVLHGLIHLRDGDGEEKKRETLIDRFTTSIYTAGEGEFYDLNLKDALERIRQGQEIFRELNFPATGFVAPAWLLSKDSEWAARRCGFDYTTRVDSITDLVHDQTHPSRALVWSVRNRWRRQVSRAWNHWLNGKLEPNPLIRLAIHPVDLAHPQIWKQVLHLANTLESARPVMTYAQWITRWRAASGRSAVRPAQTEMPTPP